MTVLCTRDFFKKLGAPLKNPQWSWGAFHPEKNRLFLKVWTDEVIHENGRYFHILLKGEHRQPTTQLGAKERLAQIDMIKQGVQPYLVMCSCESNKSNTRKIKKVNQNNVFQAGEIIEKDGHLWIESLQPIAVDQL